MIPTSSDPSPKAPQTLFDKIWKAHIVSEAEGGQTLLYIDRHYLSDDLPSSSYECLQARDLKVRRPELSFAMPDHYVSTKGASLDDICDAERRDMVSGLAREAANRGIAHFGLGDPRQGIVHVVGPEQGLSLPGMTVVCGDSHTSTHGALGSFGFGIGASEVSHVLATQTLWQLKPGNMRVHIQGRCGPGVTAKDLALAVIRRIGVSGASGLVVEYTGEVITNLSVEGRMTLCNLSTEAGARGGIIAPDSKTLAYLVDRPYAPHGSDWDAHCAAWQNLYSDEGAVFARDEKFSADMLHPMVSWGIDPSQSCDITQSIPPLHAIHDEDSRRAFERALLYMGLQPEQALQGLPIDRVFIGSCTNGRIEDLRLAASVLQGRRARVPTLVVPGSGLVKAQAEAEGLDQLFLAAGMIWGQPGCSMCLAINGDQGRPGERCVSTTNRNFIGRQGPGVRTHLVNPGMAAAAAVNGYLIDYREELPYAHP